MGSRTPPRRALSLRRWREYVAALYPALRLSRSKTDLCDRCVRIEIELSTPGVSEERKKSLLEETNLHLEEAVKQRELWSKFIKVYVQKTDPNLNLDDTCFPVMIDDAKVQTPDECEGTSEVSGLCSGLLQIGLSTGENKEEVKEDLADVKSEIETTDPILVQLQAEDYGGRGHCPTSLWLQTTVSGLL